MRNSKRGAVPDDLGWLYDELDTLRRRLDTVETPSGEARNATVATLQAQILDLSGRVSYYLDDTATDILGYSRAASVDSSEYIPNIMYGQILSFTLTEPRLVRLVSTTSIATSFTAQSTSRAGSAGIEVGIMLDGKSVEQNSARDRAFADVSQGEPIIRQNAQSKRARVERYVPLNAGDHTLQTFLPFVQFNAYNGSTAGSWNARVSVDANYLAVDVLQKVAPVPLP